MSLVLSRRNRESITIELGGRVVTIEVAHIHNRHVHLVVTAPRDVRITRSELIERDKGAA